MVQIKDTSVKIGIQGNFGMLILKQLGYNLNFAQECRNVQFKMADIEIFYETNNMFIIVKIMYDSGKSFQIQDGCKYLDFDRFCNDSGSDYMQKVHICPKNDRTI